MVLKCSTRPSLYFLIFWLYLEKTKASVVESELFEHLMHDYNKIAMPNRNASDILTIKFGASLIRIIDVDLKNQVFTTNLWLEMEWTDKNFKWSPVDYGNVTKLHIPVDLLWMPDIVLYNNAAGNPEITIQNDALVFSDGRVVWKPPAIYKSFCQMNVTWFPYDSQNCEMKFGLWSHTGSYADMRHSDASHIIHVPKDDGGSGTDELLMMGMDLSYFYESAEWDLLNLTSIRHEKIYPGCCGAEKYVDITYYFRLRRKRLFFTVNLIIPCFLISCLTTFVFYLSDHKITFAISILVTLSVFFLVLIDIIPPTSVVIPMIGRYLLWTMTLVTLSIAISVISVNFHFRRGCTHKMPNWMRTVFIDFLPRMLFMGKPIKEPPNSANFQLMQSRHFAKIQIFDDEKSSPIANVRRVCARSARFLSHVQHETGSFFDRSHLENLRARSPVAWQKIQKNRTNANEDLQRKLHMRVVKQLLSQIGSIAEYYRNLDEDEQEAEEWRFVAKVIDRMFLFCYAFFNIGTLFIILQAPTLYDGDLPLPKVSAFKPFGVT